MCVCESDPEPRLTFVKEEERQRSCTLFYKIKNRSKAIQSLLRLEGQHKMNPLEYRIELSQHLGSFRFFFIDF